MSQEKQSLLTDALSILRRDVLALGLSVFAAGLFGFGRPFDGAAAQTVQALAQDAPALDALQMGASARAEVLRALEAMDTRTLSLTYARIHATFRHLLGAQDLTIARALVDYAALTEAELSRRATARPAGTESAAQMLRLYELVL